MAAETNRRAILLSTMTTAGWLAASACGAAQTDARAAAKTTDARAEEEVSANEDLMREHGVLDRLLLVYEAGLARPAQDPQAIAAIHRAADLVSTFIEQYHEKLEEDFIFPLLEKARRHPAEIGILKDQHLVGRQVTQTILRLTAGSTASDHEALSQSIQAFIRMYRPHAAREDTIIFPTLHEVVTPSQLADLGERFEDVEHERFGKEGFESILRQVEDLERTLGTHELSQFTPVVARPR
jgi:hemerythrin-like domain-containing protein